MVVLGGVLLLVSLFAVGLMSRLCSESTFDFCEEYRQSAFTVMQGRPVFGTGPARFPCYVTEYRPEFYVERLGLDLRGSAAHNIGLPFGAIGASSD